MNHKYFADNDRLSNEDIQLFADMQGKWVSENEKKFFETLENKEMHELAPCGDELLLNDENEDGLEIIRNDFSEYEITGSNASTNAVSHGQYCSTLKEALSVNLKNANLLERDITLLDWLRENDYKAINYKRNIAVD